MRLDLQMTIEKKERANEFDITAANRAWKESGNKIHQTNPSPSNKKEIQVLMKIYCQSEKKIGRAHV